MAGQPPALFSEKHPTLVIRQEEPLNAGPPLETLAEAFITPNDLFFVRNHAPIPDIDPHTYRLSIGGMVHQPLSLSLEQLKRDFPRVSIPATLQCAGNRRRELLEIEAIPDELPWDAEAISTAVWTGAPLGAVLQAAGPQAGALHAALNGLDIITKKQDTFPFGASIPLAKALASEVILAYEMNGEPLPPEHGFPLRAVVPGYIGARSVKWLAEITLQKCSSNNYFQAHAYKLFPPHVRAATADWERGLMLGELSVTAVICRPAPATEVAAGRCQIQGYAMAGGGRLIERVDLSCDGGQNWIEAGLTGESEPWAWRLWSATLDLPPGEHCLVARAWDSAANTQPEDLHQIWNFKGYMNNAWHRVTIQAC